MQHVTKDITNDATQSPYQSDFWCTYVANTALMVAVSIAFRYSDFIVHLGGNEWHLGWIAGFGMVGAVVMRFAQGRGVDHYGPRAVWIVSLMGCCMSLLAHTFVTRVDGPIIYILRLVYATSVAGAFGSAITYVSLRAPRGRTAELIGALGSSGFIGMAVGPMVGDWLLSSRSMTRLDINLIFYSAAAFVGVSLIAAMMTREGALPRPRKQPAVHQLVFRYRPGAIMLMGVAMGVGICLPGTFLRPFTANLGIEKLKVYFLVYAIVAFIVRVITRKLPDRWGAKRTALLGMALLVASMVAYLPVQNQWDLALPAALAGGAHAFLFPVVVAEGSLTFPLRYRGLGTALMLASFDTGGLLGQPTVGAMIHVADRAGIPAYPTMFVGVAMGLALATIAYLMLSDRTTTATTLQSARA